MVGVLVRLRHSCCIAHLQKRDPRPRIFIVGCHSQILPVIIASDLGTKAFCDLLHVGRLKSMPEILDRYYFHLGLVNSCDL